MGINCRMTSADECNGKLQYNTISVVGYTAYSAIAVHRKDSEQGRNG